jgi:Ferritin-like domain
MVSNRIMRGGAVRRACLTAAIVATAIALAGCGEGGDIATAVPDKEGDAKMLNELLGRQLAAVAAYDRSMPALSGPELALARQFRSQEQEHVDTVVKALRGIGAKYEPPEEEIDVTDLTDEADYLDFFYVMESATIDFELEVIGELTASFVRPQLAAIVANQAQHLVLLRQALGAEGPQLVPDAFEAGTTPAPPAGKG